MDIFKIILTQPLTNLLFVILAFIPGHDFGIAVILITAIIRFALWPVFSKQLHSQKKMQQLQPEIAKIREQAKGDKTKESQMLMQLYKEKEVSPFSSCLPLIIQFPFLIALFVVFNQTGEGFDKVSQMLYEPVRNLPYIKSLILDPSAYKPVLFGFISMSKPSIALAIIAGVLQFAQTKMITPKPDSKDKQAKAMNSMTLLFPIVTIAIAWKLPAALPLYWTVTTLIAILQQWIIMKGEVEKMEKIPLRRRIVNKIRSIRKKKK